MARGTEIMARTILLLDVSGVGGLAYSGMTGDNAGVVTSLAMGGILGIPVGGGRKQALALASEMTMAEARSGGGKIIAGGSSGTAFRDAARFAKQYGGAPEDYVKKTSSTVIVQGKGYVQKVETHWVENVRTGDQFEFKTKIRD
jgi:hypothetical protein